VIDLEAALFDLAEHLDHATGDRLDDAVRRRISSATAGERPRRRARALLAIAATIVVLAAAIVSIGPARHAIADWLGVGAVEVHVSEGPRPPGTGTNTVPGASGSGPVAPTSGAARQLAVARKHVKFSIVTPGAASAGALAGVDVDARVRGGLVVLRYPRFTLVEIATRPADAPILRKLLDPAAQVESVTVAGTPGLWITGVHEIGYLDRNGNLEKDTVRRSGPVLLWARAAVTYRIEGLARLVDAEAIARTLG
jgi:hypothetical protein